MLHITCALKHEAKPIIEQFELFHDGSASLFSTCINRNKGISLTVTGVGKIAAASATVFAIMHHGAAATDAWLNLGIAGHTSLPIGTAVLANRIINSSNGNAWYPQIHFKTSLESRGLRTMDKPSLDYEDDMFDMEAAGFYNSASRLGSTDLIHCLKIISDNDANPPKEISKRTITELIENSLPEISNVISNLQACSEKAAISHKLQVTSDKN